ncbi:MAG: hypothetical protein UT37_C0009G0005 [Parcubacteria group bacterium GW2011_GWA2_39_18]|nr:MAG: hypothetical protein UT37_C0009G0005 [Parcubacteria group bacterium GW2011_GWA2_39_18]
MSDEKKGFEVSSSLAIIIAGGLIALAIFLKDSSVLGTSKGSNGSTTPGVTLTPTAATVAQSLKVGDSVTLGNSKAKVTVYVFSDFQCPYCAAAEGADNALAKSFKAQGNWEASEPKLKEYANAGKILLVFKNYPFLGNESGLTANAAMCANEQGKFWEMHSLIFSKQPKDASGNPEENKGAFTNDSLKGMARDLGLNTQKFNDCLDKSKYQAQIDKEKAEGDAAAKELGQPGLGTPAYFINGELTSGAVPWSVLQPLIDQKLK